MSARSKEELRAAKAIARAVAEDVALAIRKGVEDAQKRGQPFESFARTFKRVLSQHGWWGRKDQVNPKTGIPTETPNKFPHRVRLVIETNTRTARAAGQWARVQRTKAALPLLMYAHGQPERDRPEHEPYWQKPVILPVDHPFWNIMYGQKGYGCTCHQIPIAGGAITTEDDLPARIKVRGYETYPGIDPTFAYNPGKDRLEGLRRAGILRGKPAK